MARWSRSPTTLKLTTGSRSAAHHQHEGVLVHVRDPPRLRERRPDLRGQLDRSSKLRTLESRFPPLFGVVSSKCNCIHASFLASVIVFMRHF